MMRISIATLLFLISLSVIAQTKGKIQKNAEPKKVVDVFAAIDAKALQLPDSLSTNTDGIARYINAHFNTEGDKVRAIFIWLASNIQYDVENMFAINFYADPKEKIDKSLKTRKGICADYATLFNEICSKTGIRSYEVVGFTKQAGFTDYIPHAWCAAQVDSSWYMFDPTWGSGYLMNNKFYKKINNNYYKVPPSVLIKTHMPFDYLWQFLHYPVTAQEFYEGNVLENKIKPYFHFSDSILANEKLSPIEKLKAKAARIEKNGLKNSMIFAELQEIKLEIEHTKQNDMAALYNSASVDYNNSISLLNTFIQYRNKQFIPEKTDAEIQAMLDTTHTLINIAKTKLDSIKEPSAANAILITQFYKSIADAAAQTKEQQDFLTAYFPKSKSKRKAMFYERKVSWFGIPLN
jgi:hypothetical protein